jgi:hypothetical protein
MMMIMMMEEEEEEEKCLCEWTLNIHCDACHLLTLPILNACTNLATVPIQQGIITQCFT